MMTTRQCKKCGEVKPDTEFYRTSGATCKACHKAYRDAYRLANKEKIVAVDAVYREMNKEKRALNARIYRATNSEKVSLSAKTYSVANREKRNAYFKHYREMNKGKWLAKSAKRRASKKKATPTWANLAAIQGYYDVAAFFNDVNGYIKYHVDHVVPLRGKNVSGLHVHQNLRIILASENLGKSNKFEI